MKIKTKLTLGVGLLFLLILLLGIVGTGYINKIKADTENILTDNYNTLEYARKMLSTLEDSSAESKKIFESNLQKQEINISEIGEEEITKTLRRYYTRFGKESQDSTLVSSIRNTIYEIMDMNMQAIQRKSEHAQGNRQYS